MLAVGVQLPWQLGCDPGERNTGLRAAQLPESGLRDLDLAGHAGGDRQHAIRAGQIAALADRLAGKRDRFVVVSADELGVSPRRDRAGSGGSRVA